MPHTSGNKKGSVFGKKMLLPASCELSFGEVAGQADSEEKRLAVKLVVRTNTPVNTWIGSIIHDHSGMFHKDKVPLDWIHGDELIGFLDRFEISNKEIVCTGEVVSTSLEDQASSIIKQAVAGIPFESSIYYGGQGLEVEEIPEDKSAIVNGKRFHGPGLIMRKWPLRGVAICPHGADNKTSVDLMTDEGIVPVLVLYQNTKEETMSADANKSELDKKSEEEKKAAEQKVLELAEQKKLDDEAIKLAKKKEVDEELEKLVAVTLPASSDGTSGAKFIEAYGTDGAVWFAEGKSFAEAGALYTQKLQDRVEKLEKLLKAVDRGGKEAADFNDGDEDKEAKVAENLSLKIGQGPATFAAGLKLPK